MDTSATTSFRLEPIYGSLPLGLTLAAIVVVVVLAVRPPIKDDRRRRWLISLRLIAAVPLILAILRPTLYRTDTRPAEAALIIAADTSRSMTLPDGDGDTRWQTQQRLWQTLADEFIGDDESLVVRLVTYDAESRAISDPSPTSLDVVTPQGDLTDLTAAVTGTLQAAQGQPIAGVVLLGDGTQTAPVRGTGAQRVVETLDSLGVPLWTVPIGPAGDTTSTRDVAVEALSESYQLFAGNAVDVSFQVRTQGLTSVRLPVRLSWIDQTGSETEIAVRNITPSRSPDAIAVTIPVQAPDPGTYQLKVTADPQPGEMVTTNNTQVAFVEVRDGGGRILYLEGTNRLEQVFLRRSIRRFSPDLDLTYQWIPSDTSEQWPVDHPDWFQQGRFDIYIIGDLDADALGQTQLQALADRIADGSGLLMLGGLHTYGAGGYATSPLADVLPIEMNPDDRNLVNADPASRRDQIPGPVEIRLARRHQITDLGGDDPASIWRSLPPLTGANRLGPLKVAPGVTVLLETPNQDPLLVIGQYGRGRTVAAAFDSTWRWWRAGNIEAHKRFWRQLILWLLSREELGGDQIMIELDSRRFATTQPPEFRAFVRSLDDQTTTYQLVAEVVDEQGNVTPVVTRTVVNTTSSGNPAETIVGRLPELPPGIFRLRVRPEPSSASLEAQEKAFQVIQQSRELERPLADPVYLRQLAQMTSQHGGATFSPDEIDALIETISQRRQKSETPVVEQFRLGDGPISGWILFLVFCAALTVDWTLRRRWGLA